MQITQMYLAFFTEKISLFLEKLTKLSVKNMSIFNQIQFLLETGIDFHTDVITIARLGSKQMFSWICEFCSSQLFSVIF